MRSCSAEINGKPRLMCMTRMSTFDEDEVVTVTPMRTFPVIRDLVTDVSFNYEKAREIPSFAPPKDLQPGEYRMAQVDVERSQEFRKCIECFLCQNVCHVIRDHEENKEAFAGPRFLMRIAELDMHPLDTLDRQEQAQEEHGLGFCNITKCCTEVCPENIKITDNALIPMKERVADRKYDPVVWLGNKLFRRTEVGRKRDLEGSAFAGVTRGTGVAGSMRETTSVNEIRTAIRELSVARRAGAQRGTALTTRRRSSGGSTAYRDELGERPDGSRLTARRRGGGICCGGTRSGPPGRPPSPR